MIVLPRDQAEINWFAQITSLDWEGKFGSGETDAVLSRNYDVAWDLTLNVILNDLLVAY